MMHRRDTLRIAGAHCGKVDWDERSDTLSATPSNVRLHRGGDPQTLHLEDQTGVTELDDPGMYNNN